jgi:hypothetical protein
MDDLVNKRVRALAADHGLTVQETLAALDKHPIELDRNQFLSLRGRIGADSRPFAPLPVRRRKKQWQALAEIRRLEAALLNAVRVDVGPVLECLLDDRPRNHPDRAR